VGAIKANGISQETDYEADDEDRPRLVVTGTSSEFIRPIESADAARLSGRPRRALCAHRWRPNRLRRESRPCELWLVDVWLGSWDQPVASQ
jgi:hypothetical protein